MNIGYGKIDTSNKFATELNNSNCPICGKHIYVYIYKRGVDFTCSDIHCPLGHGAISIIDNIREINHILFLIENQ